MKYHVTLNARRAVDKKFFTLLDITINAEDTGDAWRIAGETAAVVWRVDAATTRTSETILQVVGNA